jgi:hypothetical protein
LRFRFVNRSIEGMPNRIASATGIAIAIVRQAPRAQAMLVTGGSLTVRSLRAPALAQGHGPRTPSAVYPNINGAPALACQGSSASSAQPDLVRLFPEQLHRPELPQAHCPARAGAVVMFQ